MPSIAIDAGPIIAACDARDPHHSRVVAWLSSNRQPLVTNWLAVTEAFRLLGRDPRAARSMVDWVRRALSIDESTLLDIDRILEVMSKYESLPADLTDAALLAMCERLDIRRIATLDSDFEVYRTKSRKTLVNVLAK